VAGGRALGIAPMFGEPIAITSRDPLTGTRSRLQTRGSSNAKAKRELGWRPQYASWRDGFRAVLQQEAARARARRLAPIGATRRLRRRDEE
jgi:nucleoside-diphosphate-sugar epimerase